MRNNKQVKKGITTKPIQFNKGKVILSKSQFNGVTTYTESHYFSVKNIVITLLVIIAIITSHLTII